MVIVWGSGLYGKVDVVPGVGHVATTFGHLYYFPLFPTGSHFVVSQGAGGWHGVSIGLSVKSILMAWFRAALMVASFVALIWALIECVDTKQGVMQGNAVTAGIWFVALVTLLSSSYWWKYVAIASYTRAKQLTEQIGLDERSRIMMDLHYGEVTEQEAESSLSKLATDQTRR